MDRFLAGATLFIQRVFGDSFIHVDYDFVEVVEKESRATAPLLLCSMPGHDASSKVEDTAHKLSKKDYKSDNFSLSSFFVVSSHSHSHSHSFSLKSILFK
jgi:hypothetical protein